MKQHTKTLGQVFLHDQNIIKKIITLGNPSPDLAIIEIGCGRGILTKALHTIAPVHVIEIDERWLNEVKNMNLKNVTFHHIDALKVRYDTFPKGSAIIANIPYQITSPLIEQFTKFKHHLGPITIMVQKELADRLMAPPNTKQYGALTIFCNLHFTIQKGFFVSRNCFTPKPNVDSYVLQLLPKKPLLSPDEEQLFLAMTRTFFWGRRKTMRTCLKSNPYIEKPSTIPDELTTTLKKRVEEFALIDLINVFHQLKPYLIIKKTSTIK